jgi:hypothetical protein
MNTLEKVSVIPAEAPSKSIAVMTPMDMIQRAVESGADIEMLEKLMALQERWEAGNARKAFDNAMSEAKAEIPLITKNREVDFTSAKGRTHYKYEDLGEVAKIVNPILAKHGLSYRFRTTSLVNEPVTVTCIVSHRDGHFEENTLCAGRDDSGNKNSIQAIGSTLTYLQRMTLKAALGIAVANDDDGKTSSAGEQSAPAPGSITEKQADDLRDLLEAKGASAQAFLGWARQQGLFDVKRIDDIPAEHFKASQDAINTFKKAGK